MCPRLIASAALLGLASLATAHPAPYSYLDLHLDASGAHGTLVVHDYDAAHELGITEPEALLDPATAAAQREPLLALFQSRLQIRIDDAPRALNWGAIEVLPERQSLRLPFELGAAARVTAGVGAQLFPYDVTHQSFINVYENGVLKHQAIVDATAPRALYYLGTLQGRWAVVRTFVVSGIRHILIGPDHILFLAGLLLLGGSLWRLTGIVSAFTAGHSITLSLAALGLVQLTPRIVEPAIALSIVVAGVDNLLVAGQRRGADATASTVSSATGRARDLRPWLAGSFGLIHGFGFASVLAELGLPRNALAWSLASFNVGVEIGQLIIVVVLASLLAWATRQSALAARCCLQAGSVAVILAGAYWFVQRVWFTVGV